jgi:hypothetical protein
MSTLLQVVGWCLLAIGALALAAYGWDRFTTRRRP